jgi:hypothetical protein
MGGFGSGPRNAGRALTSERLQLDIRQLARDGLLHACAGSARIYWQEGGRTIAGVEARLHAGQLELSYAGDTSPAEDSVERVSVQTTPCTYGGRRQWFLCAQCSRRCAILYADRIGFACRYCLDLRYPSQRRHRAARARARVEAIGRRLGWAPNGAGGGKPPRMHLRTFTRLAALYVRYVDESQEDIVRLAERLLRRFGR